MDSSKAPELSTLTGWLSFAEEATRKKHWEWFVIDQFLKGNHNVRGNPNDNSIEVSRRIESVNFPINEIRLNFWALKSYVTRHKPKVTVEPDELQPNAMDYARRANRIIERDNKLNNGRRLNKEWAYFGIKYGIGWRQMGYDPTKKVCIRWTVDPFDLLIGSRVGKLEDAPYIIKTVVRTIGYWKNKYPKANIAPDNEVAADEYKKLSYQIEFSDTSASGQGLDEQTAIGYECWYRVFKKNKNGGLINKVLFVKSDVVDFEETPYEDYPFIPYECEIEPNVPRPDGRIKDLIAPQRLLNLLNTQLIEYNHVSNRGRILVPKNSGFEVVQAKEGQIIRYNTGKRPEVMNPSAVNPMLQWQIGFAEKKMQDIGGYQDASRGRLPSSGMSGDAIEALQTADSNLLADPRENFEDSLSMEAAWILKMYSLFEKDGVVLTDELPDSTEKKQFGFVGQAAYENMGKKIPDKYFIETNGTYTDIMGVLPDNQVSVSVTSELGETKEARMNLLLKLNERGLPLSVVMQHLEFPNTKDVLQRIAEESVADMAMQQMQQPGVPGSMPPGVGGQPPVTPPPPPNEGA